MSFLCQSACYTEGVLRATRTAGRNRSHSQQEPVWSGEDSEEVRKVQDVRYEAKAAQDAKEGKMSSLEGF